MEPWLSLPGTEAVGFGSDEEPADLAIRSDKNTFRNAKPALQFHFWTELQMTSMDANIAWQHETTAAMAGGLATSTAVSTKTKTVTG
jgi:hypothetical protein